MSSPASTFRPFLDHIALEEAGNSEGSYDDVGRLSVLFDVLGAAVADSHGAVTRFGLGREQIGNRTAHYVAAAEHDAVLAPGLDAVFLKQGYDAVGSGAYECVESEAETADVLGVESVDILGRADGHNDLLFVDMLGKRKLDDEAVDAVVVVQSFDLGKQFFLGGAGGKTKHGAVESDLFAGAFLVGYICLARSVISHEDRGQMRPAPAFVKEIINFGCDLSLKVCRCGSSVK